MARPARRRCQKVLSTKLLFHISIIRGRPGGRPMAVARPTWRSKARCVPRRRRRSVRFCRRRRTLPPFFLFMEQHRKQLQAAYPCMTAVQMAKRLGRMWQKLPCRERERYMDRAECLKGRRSKCRSRWPPAPRSICRRRGMNNLMVCFSTKASSLRNFLMSYL